MNFNGVKVFSATMGRDRDALGDKVTDWLRDHTSYEVTDIVVKQSSDAEFHCLSITVFYVDPAVAVRSTPDKPRRIPR